MLVLRNYYHKFNLKRREALALFIQMLVLLVHLLYREEIIFEKNLAKPHIPP